MVALALAKRSESQHDRWGTIGDEIELAHDVASVVYEGDDEHESHVVVQPRVDDVGGIGIDLCVLDGVAVTQPVADAVCVADAECLVVDVSVVVSLVVEDREPSHTIALLLETAPHRLSIGLIVALRYAAHFGNDRHDVTEPQWKVRVAAGYAVSHVWNS